MGGLSGSYGAISNLCRVSTRHSFRPLGTPTPPRSKRHPDAALFTTGSTVPSTVSAGACHCWRKAVAYSAARWNINYTHIPLCFDGHFLHVDRVYQNHVTIILDFIGARVTEVVSGGNRCCKTCKALVKSSVHQQTNTQLYTGRIPLPSPSSSVRTLNGKVTAVAIKNFFPIPSPLLQMLSPHLVIMYHIISEYRSWVFDLCAVVGMALERYC